MDKYNNSVGGAVGNSITATRPSDALTASKPVSEIEREFNKLGGALDYLCTRIGILENRLAPVMMPDSPKASGEKDIEPVTQIGKGVRNAKDVVDSQIYRIESMLQRLSI